MGFKAPAIDFTSTAQQITQSANRAMDNITKAVEFDFSMLEKRRVEFMNEMELTQLNDFLRGRNEEAALETINQFSDRWADIYSERNGRLSNRDLMNMRREKQVVEQIIQRSNTIQQQLEEAQKVLRSPQGGDFSGEYFRKALDGYYKTGEDPSVDVPGVSSSNPWLKMQERDLAVMLGQERRPQPLGSLRDISVRPDGTIEILDKETFATDEDRERYIIDRMRSDNLFAFSAQVGFEDLNNEQQEQIRTQAAQHGRHFLDQYALEFKDFLWRDRSIRRDDITSMRRQWTEERKPDPTDLSGTRIRDLDFHNRKYKGYDLLPHGINLDINLTNVVNLLTGEVESPGGVPVVLSGYAPDTNKLIVEATLDRYAAPLRKGDEILYRAERTDTRGTPLMGTKEEIEKMREERKGQATYSDPVPERDTARRTKVNYELDLDREEYANLLREFRFPVRQPTKKVDVLTQMGIE